MKDMGKLLFLIFLFPLFSFASQTTQVCFNDKCLQAKIALTPEEHMRGLMFRETLGEEEGMLFVFEAQALRSFWMKNMGFPIDIIWMDEDKTVIDVTESAEPCLSNGACPSIIPKGPSRFVLETNAGFCRKNGIKPAVKASFKLP